MSKKVEHINLPEVSVFTKGAVLVTTRKESYKGVSPVLKAMEDSGEVAYWGANNDLPQRVIADTKKYPLMRGVVDLKCGMLIGDGVRYGTVRWDETTRTELFEPQSLPEIDDFLEESNFNLYLSEAARDWYMFANIFPEFRMNRGYTKVLGMGCFDASHVRLHTQNKTSGDIETAYIADWCNADAQSAIVRPALDPYYDVAEQLLEMRKPRAVLPLRDLGLGQFYYGETPWDGLRGNGWFDLAIRIPELKNLLLQGLMNIRYHIEIDERYWIQKWPDWNKKDQATRIDLQSKEVDAIETWLKKDGINGAFMSSMKGSTTGTDQISLVKINEKRIVIPEGSYLEDSQEVDFIFCRDMGLKPSLYGISPSKSGSSPGSGSEDRVARTNHILNCRRDMDKLLQPLSVVRKVNNWPKGTRFWLAGYHAATLDRTMAVDKKANAGTEK